MAEQPHPPDLVVEQEPLAYLGQHARISRRFRVERVLDVSPLGECGLDGLALTERPLEHPWDDDADAVNPPGDWPARYDTSRWGLLSAYLHHERVGGAVIAYPAPGPHLREQSPDLATLWDLRVAPAARRQGVGRTLFEAVEQWARSRGCHHLSAETCTTNVAACRFYARMRCVLESIDRSARRDRPQEARLVWYRALASDG